MYLINDCYLKYVTNLHNNKKTNSTKFLTCKISEWTLHQRRHTDGKQTEKMFSIISHQENHCQKMKTMKCHCTSIRKNTILNLHQVLTIPKAKGTFHTSLLGMQMVNHFGKPLCSFKVKHTLMGSRKARSQVFMKNEESLQHVYS